MRTAPDGADRAQGQQVPSCTQSRQAPTRARMARRTDAREGPAGTNAREWPVRTNARAQGRHWAAHPRAPGTPLHSGAKHRARASGPPSSKHKAGRRHEAPGSPPALRAPATRQPTSARSAPRLAPHWHTATAKRSTERARAGYPAARRPTYPAPLHVCIARKAAGH